MNDLDVLREHCPDHPLRSAAELSPAREALLAGIMAPNRHGPVRRIAIGGVSVAAAAAITAGLLAGTHGVAQRTPPAGHAPVAAQLTAKEVLDAAAAAALRAPGVVPKPDQFIYSENEGGIPVGAVIRTWTSVDGERNGLITSTGPDGQTHPATVVSGPGFFPDMPTKAGLMLAYLERTQDVRPGDVNDVAKTVGEMLLSDYFTPAQRAALYEFLASYPGLSVQTGVKDTIGRPGTGVSWGTLGDQDKTTLVFDPRTYSLLALLTWGEGHEGGTALIRTAVVNRTGQLP